MTTNKVREFSGSHGIAEWYGNLYRSLSNSERLSFATPSGNQPCRFLQDVPELAPKKGTKCTKKGGVCSIRSFTTSLESAVDFGTITATCPNRFLEGGKIIEAIGLALLGTASPVVVKEVPFLQRISGTSDLMSDGNSEADTDTDPADQREDVGKIDLVCVHPDTSRLNWCAVELQAVYFSGGAMSKDVEAIKAYKGNGIPLPGAGRRPDFRSSGPKRLMPQLQIKVPTLRRWGKKMAVVVDQAFFDALAPMERVAHVSNADIAWIIVDYSESGQSAKATLHVADIFYTTLERAVEGLTAGNPSDQPSFERRILSKVSKS